MIEFVASIAILLIPLTVLFVLMCAFVEAIFLIENSIAFLRSKRIQLNSTVLNKSFKGNHRKGGDRRHYDDRRHYHADRRQIMHV